MKRSLGIGLASVLAGCAATSPPQPSASAPRDGADMVCEKVYPTGSNLAKTVCTTAEDRRRQQQEVEAAGERIRQGPAMPTGRPGG